MVTTKFTPAGAELWTARFNINADHSGQEFAEVVAVSSAGEVYVTGFSSAPSPAFSGATTVKYSTIGAQAWVQEFAPEERNQSEQAAPVAISLGAGGQIFLAATAPGAENWATTDYVQDAAETVPAGLSFGNEALNLTSTSQTVNLKNIAQVPLTIRTINITGDFHDFHLGNNCPDTLAPGASCSLFLTFTPTALGTRTATVIMRDNWPGNGSDPATLTLSGVGVAQ
jgi:hypothetical protein